jgi:hypothetical protein
MSFRYCSDASSYRAHGTQERVEVVDRSQDRLFTGELPSLHQAPPPAASADATGESSPSWQHIPRSVRRRHDEFERVLDHVYVPSAVLLAIERIRVTNGKTSRGALAHDLVCFARTHVRGQMYADESPVGLKSGRAGTTAARSSTGSAKASTSASGDSSPDDDDDGHEDAPPPPKQYPLE